MKIQIKDINEGVVPKTATPLSAGYDVVALDEPKIVGKKIDNLWTSIDYIEYKTGLFIAPQTDSYSNNYHTLIFPRSSIRKYNLVFANSVALIDNDYRGEIFVCFKYMWQPEDYVVVTTGQSGSVYGRLNLDKIYKKGDTMAQLVAEVTNPIDWIVVTELSSTVRGEGGFGSTDVKKAEKKPIEIPKAATNLINMWKESENTPTPQKYEAIIREREKLIQ